MSIENIKVIILAGSRDFGRCPLASRLPAALWPILGNPALQRLLKHLSRQGIKQATVCSNGDVSLLQRSITNVNSIHLKFLDESLPAGTAGCIRDAADGDRNALFLVFQAGIASPPNIDMLIRTHRVGKSDLTAIFEPDLENAHPAGKTSDIYICEPTVLEYIPQKGYYDIKEGLIPALIRAGRTVHASTLTQCIGNFRDRATYLTAIASYLQSNTNIDFPHNKWKGLKNVWLGDNVRVDQSAKIYGPVVIMDGSAILEKAIIFGPAIVGRNVTIGKNTLVDNSVFWDGSSTGRNCEIRRCVIDYNAVISSNSIVEDRAVTHKQNAFTNGINKAISSVNDKAEKLYSAARPLINKINAKLPVCVQSKNSIPNVLRLCGMAILTGVLLWSYWPEFADLWDIWQRSDEYSSGLLVPFIALYILWARRKQIAQCHIHPSMWGLLAFVAAQALRGFGLFFMYSSAERLSLVLTIASLTLLLFGWQVFRKISSVLLFLCLMLPFPRSVHTAVMLPLQNLATTSAVFCLEMMGYVVIREGNIVHLNGTTVAVAEACNGLRMVTAFFVIVGLVILLVRRAWWEKLIVLISSLPIALLCNVVRLTITAIAFTKLTGENWEGIFHDFGGYAMMPLALALVIFELWLLTKLTTIPEKKPQEIVMRKSEK